MNSIRPNFLTVLCILTFIGSAYGIFQAITSYTTADVTVGVAKDAMEEVTDQIEDQADSEKEAEMANKIIGSITDGLTVENVKQIGIASGISNLLTLLGAILMWGLNKKGFWLYAIGTAIIIFAPIFIYGGFMGAAAGGVYAFIGILFCVLYGMNLKHMS